MGLKPEQMQESDINLRGELERRLRFETLLADLSARFVNVPAEAVDREINQALRLICEHLGNDTAVLWQQLQDDPGNMLLTHYHRPVGGPPVPGRMEAKSYFPWSLAKILRGEILAITRLADLPIEAVRDAETRRYFNLKSTLAFPLSTGGGPVFGVLSFDSMSKELEWPEPLVKRLQLVARILASALDRKRSELALRESEARLSLAAGSAGAGLWSLDAATGNFWATPRALALFEFAPGEAVTLQRFLKSVHAEDRARVQQMVEVALESGEGVDIEYRILLPDGRMRWIFSRGLPQRNASGNWAQLTGASIDITDRKQAEEALRESYAEIERLKDRLQAESNYLREEIKVTQTHGEVIGQSQAIKQVLQKVEQVAHTESSVLITGETGTGKELIARAIHRLSPRKDRVMVLVNCAALPGALVESELFGREKGAFTGALMRQAGRFELADGSSIFLDEVGELSPEVQAKLLRVLQSGEFERLGSSKTLRVNVRLIAATNRDLTQDVRKGRFREDLFYRLNVFPIRVPPLRERPEDIPELVWGFLEELCPRIGKKITKVPRRTMDALQAYSWPGNIRELRNVIEHGVIVTSGETLQVSPPGEAGPTKAAPTTLAELQREHILETLERSNWRIKGPGGAAQKLGLKPSTLYTRMEKLGIPTRRAKEEAGAA
jgi:formate hydrogenlyase transcriptional activator